MSQITRCPSCGTKFKVVADQLRVSEGWVRCGHCEDIFDASAHLLPTDTPLLLPETWEEATEPPPRLPLSDGLGQDFSPEVLAGYELPSPALTDMPWADGPLSDAPPDPALTAAEALAETPAPPWSAPAVPCGAEEGALQEPGFVRAARRRAWWHQPLVRCGLALSALGLLLVLGAQVVLQERGRLMALDARVRSAVEAVCGLLHCAQHPLRNIAQVAIDSSSFQKGSGERYALSLALQNHAPLALATPAVELTLTDLQDQPVLRRVLHPQDMAAPAELPAGAVWSTTLSLQITHENARIVGYRLLAFYP
ncbi:MAG: DUF3426 domain-containing protein [Burkholderiaceae bacterium]|nr:DUF3426 domain-containing protein [Burkholderiaceae bacterium]